MRGAPAGIPTRHEAEAAARAVWAKISSVLFGQQSYELKNKVAAVVLRDTKPGPAAFLVRTLDGSVWRARSLVFEEKGVRVETSLTGPWRIGAAELVEIRRGSPPAK